MEVQMQIRADDAIQQKVADIREHLSRVGVPVDRSAAIRWAIDRAWAEIQGKNEQGRKKR